jgi:hypothetical protein
LSVKRREESGEEEDVGRLDYAHERMNLILAQMTNSVERDLGGWVLFIGNGMGNEGK